MWDNPFKGLAYFAREDHASFGGRGRDLRAVASGILKSRTFVVYGRSGLGKTSLMLAGVFPELERHHCRTAYVRALVDPLQDLHRSLTKQLDGQPGDSLHAMIDRADNDGPVVVVFDQFEEFFIRFSDQAPTDSSERLQRTSAERRARRERRKEFILEIGRLAAASDLNLRLVFSLREDWVAEMHAFEAAVPGIQDHSFRLMPMTAFGVRQSILQTLKANRVTFEAGLISALVESLSEVEFDPAVLQVVASEVWDRGLERSTAGRVHLTESDLAEVGGVWGIFKGYLECIPESTRRRHLQIRAVLDSLITRQRTKRAVQKSFFFSQYFQIAEDELDEILDMLCGYRLTRRDPRGGEEWYELIHERLVQTILDWLDSDREFPLFRSARLLVVNSCANPGWQDNPGLLLTRDQLDDTVGPYRDLLQFTEEQRLFLISSAIYNGSDNLDHWAEQAGREVTTEILEGFFADGGQESERRRRQSAAAVRFLAPGWPELADRFAERCLDLAIHGEDGETRRVAGQSFAHLAGESHFQQLAGRLAERETREAAAAVLTEVVAEEKLPRPRIFTRWQTLQARRRLFARKRTEAKDVLRARARRGARAGLVGGVIWELTAGPLLLWISLSELVPGEWASQIEILAITLTILGLFAIWLGWRIALRAGQEALWTGREGGFFFAIASRRTWIFWLGLTVASWGALGPLAALYLFWLGGSAVLAGFAKPSFWEGRSRFEILGWIWLWAFGGGMFLPMVGWALDGRLDWLSLSKYSQWAVPLGLTAGLVIFVGCLAMLYSSPSWSPYQASRLRLGEMVPASGKALQRLSRWSALGLVAAVLGLFIYSNGLDSFFLIGSKISLESGEQSIELAAGPVDTEWITLTVEEIESDELQGPGDGDSGQAEQARPRRPEEADDSDTPRLVQIRFPKEVSALSGNRQLESGSIYLAQPGDTRLAVTSKNALERQASLRLRANLDSNNDVLPEDAPRLYVVTLVHVADTRIWRGELKGQVIKFSPERTLYLSAAMTAQASDDCPDSALNLSIGGKDFESPRCEDEDTLSPLHPITLGPGVLSVYLDSTKFAVPIEASAVAAGWMAQELHVFVEAQYSSDRSQQPRAGAERQEVIHKKQNLVERREWQDRWSAVADRALEERLFKLWPAGDDPASAGGPRPVEKRLADSRETLMALRVFLAGLEPSERDEFFTAARLHAEIEKRLKKVEARSLRLVSFRARSQQILEMKEVQIPSLPLSEAEPERNEDLLQAMTAEIQRLAGEISKAEAAEADLEQLEWQRRSSALADLELEVLELDMQLGAADGLGSERGPIELRRVAILEQLDLETQQLAADLVANGVSWAGAHPLIHLNPEVRENLAKAEGQLRALD